MTQPIRQSVPRVAVFPSELGWMAIAGCEKTLFQLSFGHANPHQALTSLDAAFRGIEPVDTWFPELVARLQRFAAGQVTSFDDLEANYSGRTDFQYRVLERCRRIPWGQVMTYGELAAEVGEPRSARAVGNCMASNRMPLVIPCHRVVRSGGFVGRYSAGEGTRLKLRLLEMESAADPSKVGRRFRLLDDAGQKR